MTVSFKVCPLLILVFSLSGCIRFKDSGDVRTSVLKSQIVDESVQVLADRGVTANLTPDRGQMFMELYWWNKRKISKTTEIAKQDACLKTISIGFFPGAGAREPGVADAVVHPLPCLLLNAFCMCIPTFSSMLYGPVMDPCDVHENDYSLCEYGLFGNFSYLDRKNPKVVKNYVEKRTEEKVDETPIRLMDFEVEIDGKIFRGEKGVAYIGTVVGSKPELDVKLLSFIAPDGFPSNDVAAVCGSRFLAKVPTAADMMVAAENKRREELAVLQQQQAAQEAAAREAAAQRELAMALANAAIQGVNAGVAARNGGAYTPATPVAPSVSAASSPKLPRLCPMCFGDGKCRPCDGSGGNPAKPYIKGRLYDGMVSAKCGPCNGTGRCLGCGGTGKK